MRPLYKSSEATWRFIARVIAEGRRRDKEAATLFHLVSATLQRTFPDESIAIRTLLPDHGGSAGATEVLLGKTVFHITAQPFPDGYEQCRRLLDEGYRVYLLVPDRIVDGAKVNAEYVAPGQITVASIELFVTQNLDEFATFGKDDRRIGLRALIETYNRRVNATEADKSLMIELPTNLAN